MEAAAVIMSLEHSTLPPTLNLTAPDPNLQLDLLVGQPQKVQLKHALSAAMGMGGTCSALIFSRG